MEIDKDFLDNFEYQIKLLENMKKSIDEAIGRANGRLDRIRKGESIESVFESDRRA